MQARTCVWNKYHNWKGGNEDKEDDEEDEEESEWKTQIRRWSGREEKGETKAVRKTESAAMKPTDNNKRYSKHETMNL